MMEVFNIAVEVVIDLLKHLFASDKRGEVPRRNLIIGLFSCLSGLEFDFVISAGFVLESEVLINLDYIRESSPKV